MIQVGELIKPYERQLLEKLLFEYSENDFDWDELNTDILRAEQTHKGTDQNGEND